MQNKKFRVGITLGIVAMVCIAMISMLPSTVVAEDETYTLVVAVVDKTGVGIAGAGVSLYTDTGTLLDTGITNDTGHIAFTGLETGLYKLKAKASGYYDVIWSKKVYVAENTTYVITMTELMPYSEHGGSYAQYVSYGMIFGVALLIFIVVMYYLKGQRRRKGFQ